MFIALLVLYIAKGELDRQPSDDDIWSRDMDIRTALNPWELCGGAEGRRQPGLLIAATVTIAKVKGGYSVPSQSGEGFYLVWYTRQLTDKEGWRCNCPDFEKRQEPCKHVFATLHTVERHERADGTVETTPTRRTYSQNWRAYNAAQQHEEKHFRTLLRELCDAVPQEPQQGPGRPRLPLGDMLYSIGAFFRSLLVPRSRGATDRDGPARTWRRGAIRSRCPNSGNRCRTGTWAAVPAGRSLSPRSRRRAKPTVASW